MKNDRLSSPRIHPLKESDMDEEIQPLLEGAKKIFDGRVPNLHMTLAKHKKLLKRWFVFSNHILGKATIPVRHREILILRIGWLCRCEYEWGQHLIIGKMCGLNDVEMQRISAGADADGWDSFESELIRAVDELFDNTIISDKTWKILSESYDEQQMMDLIFTVGQYNMLAMALNSMGVQLEDGIKGFS